MLILFPLHPTTTSWTRVIPLRVTSNASCRLRVSTTIGALDYSYTVSGYFVSQYYFQAGIGHSRGESPTIVVGDMESYALLFTVCYVCRCTTHCMRAHRLRAVVNCGQDQRYRNPLDWEFCCFCRAGGCLYPCLFDPAYATAGLARSNMCECACVFTNSDWCPPHMAHSVITVIVLISRQATM